MTLGVDDITMVYKLVGETLPGGWKVTEMYKRARGTTAGQFSVQYKAERDGQEYFVKVIDIEKALQTSDLDKWSETVKAQLEAFDYERRLLQKCCDRSLSKIVRVHGAELYRIPGNAIPIPFLVFEKADGNVKEYINFQDKADFVWKLKSLHDIATGIQQLHSIEVIHQDLKPSNILQFKAQSKIGDLGRSKTFGGNGLYDHESIGGDRAYAPLEVIPDYAFLQPKQYLDRNLAMDSYQLGNLMTFYFTGLNMTALVMKNLKEMGVEGGGTEEEMRSYLQVAFDSSVEEVKRAIEYEEFREDIGLMIQQLCNPDPNKRNDEKTLRQRGSNYALHRYITKLNVLQRRAEIFLLKDGAIH